MKLRFSLLLFLLCSWQIAFPQDYYSGIWNGELLLNDLPDVFSYQLDIRQSGTQIIGFAYSRSRQGGPTAKFEIGGTWKGNEIVLQELRQLEPKDPWCLKHIRLVYKESDTLALLSGTWEAHNCIPGTLTLSRKLQSLSISLPPAGKGAEPQLLSSELSGKWSGQLSQSDRGYGFYFEMKLNPDGTGISEIISDGEGGNATHNLFWNFDETTNFFHFEETAIMDKSVPKWRWCLKSGNLRFNKEAHRLSLEGDWAGYIEGFTKDDGLCAPGKLYLERPMPAPEEYSPVKDEASGQKTDLKPKPVAIEPYIKEQKREVEINRVVEVRSRRIKIRVWDNGTIDGDILSLFLNGKMLLDHHRATRQKYELLVDLEKPVNYLILHAINLGKITPNTVAVSVDDGYGEKTIMISSTLKTSGAIMIREFKID